VADAPVRGVVERAPETASQRERDATEGSSERAEAAVASASARAGPISKLLLGIVALALLVGLGRAAGGYVPAAAQWVEELGAWGPLAYIALYAVSVVFLVPGALLTLAGGAIFGIGEGTVYVFVGAVLGSAAAFLVARYLARQAVERRLSSRPRFGAIDAAVGEQGLKITFLLRLSPVFPFVLLNYALGLTRVSFRDYLIASFGMIPGTLLYVYYGRLLGEVAGLASGVAPERDANYYLVLGIGLAATLAVTWMVTRLASRALAESAPQAKAPV
jgi:uncharacterized membrane protein YdjX (TVP38/TMEM64 family)